MAFVKIDVKILDSSIWCEDSDTRVCWICLLAMAGPDGLVEATAPGISRRAGISMEATTRALGIFEGPDVNSKNPTDEGRRIRRVNGGFQILNYEFYRRKDHSSAERVRRFREKQKHYAEALTNAPKGKRAAIAELADEIIAKLKFTGGVRKPQLEELVRIDPDGIAGVRAAVDRAVLYFETAKAEKWKSFVIARRFSKFRDFYGEAFSSDEAAAAYVEKIRAANERETRKLRREASLHVGAQRPELAREERDPLEVFLEKFPKELEPIREDFERFRETRRGAAVIEEKLLELFKDDQEVAHKEAFFAKSIAKGLRTPETLRRYRVNYIRGKFGVPELEETE